MSANTKFEAVFLTMNTGSDPWARHGIERPERLNLRSLPLTLAPELVANSIVNSDDERQRTPLNAIVVDLDSIRKTKGLDSWAIQAWKATINEWVVKTIVPDHPPPEVVGYCEIANWEMARLGAQLGMRDLVSPAELGAKFAASPAATTPPRPSGELFSFTELKSRRLGADPTLETESTENTDASPPVLGPIAPDEIEIPRHVIPFPIDGLDGTSPGIEAVRKLIRRTAPLDTPVLITGTTGSGKELVAKTLHKYSPRAERAFIAVNCGAISPQLVESELFGHVKGSFTSASSDKIGLLQAADGGTLFLDELTELSGEIQVKLLRALQERSIYPVGSSTAVPIDIRLISATKDDIEERVREGRFREDLFYRLKVIEIALPSLAERRSDLPEIIKSILKRTARKHRRPALDVEESVLEKFLLYDWPGNIRELENVLERASTLCWAEGRARMTLGDIPEEIKFSTMKSGNAQHLKEVVRRFEKEFIASTIRRLGGSKELAAESLGLSLATLYRKLGS